MAKLRSIKTAVKPKPLTREKLYCQACGGDDAIPNSDFRGDTQDGILYLECSVCRADAQPYYTQQAVERLIAEAVAQALQEAPDERSE